MPYYPDQAKLGTINAVSTGLYALLGAELCVITKDNDKYLTRSYLSAQWLDNHMVTPEGLLVDNINGADCKVTDWKFTCESWITSSLISLCVVLTARQRRTIHIHLRPALHPQFQRHCPSPSRTDRQREYPDQTVELGQRHN